MKRRAFFSFLPLVPASVALPALGESIPSADQIEFRGYRLEFSGYIKSQLNSREIGRWLGVPIDKTSKMPFVVAMTSGWVAAYEVRGYEFDISQINGAPDIHSYSTELERELAKAQALDRVKVLIGALLSMKPQASRQPEYRFGWTGFRRA